MPSIVSFAVTAAVIAVSVPAGLVVVAAWAGTVTLTSDEGPFHPLTGCALVVFQV